MKRKVISLPPPPVKIGGGRHPIEADAPAARILMVDDHPPNLMALDAILDPLGQELLHAHSGEEALRQLLETDFALILMDVQMPGLDGIQTAKMIKERPRNRHIPIIFLTAIHKDPAYIFRGYKEGAVDYLLKPFDPEILRAKVSVFVDLWRKTELLRRQEAMLRAARLAEGRELELRVVPLPPGADPGELIGGEGGPEQLRALVERSVPFVVFHAERILERSELRSAEKLDQRRRRPSGADGGEVGLGVGDGFAHLLPGVGQDGIDEGFVVHQRTSVPIGSPARARRWAIRCSGSTAPICRCSGRYSERSMAWRTSRAAGCRAT